MLVPATAALSNGVLFGAVLSLAPGQAWRVLPHLAHQPIVDAAWLVGTLRLGDMAAQRALSQLAEAGVVVELTGQRRNRLYAHHGILETIDRYATDSTRSEHLF